MSEPGKPPRRVDPGPGEAQRPVDPGPGKAQRPVDPAPGKPPLPAVPAPAHYGRYALALAVVILGLITLNTILTKPNGSAGVTAGQRVPPFAAPLAAVQPAVDVDIAVHAHEGHRGDVPACRERGADVLNICALYERGPVVLALFVQRESCPDVLGDLQALAPSFPDVRFAAVSVKGSPGPLRALIAAKRISFPVAYDYEGELAALYKLATCPQLTFILPGGVAFGKALLERPSRAALRARIAALQNAAARPTSARGAG